MRIGRRSLPRVIDYALAVVVVAVAVWTFTGVPEPYPARPTLGSVPVNPELVVPGLLGLVMLSRLITDEFSGATPIVGVLGSLTLFLATMSMYILYAAEAGGVFVGGAFTLLSGIVLAAVVLLQGAVRTGRRWRRTADVSVQ
ncbi:hypothetical protein [Natrialba sp. PRR66]|uniref:hypothetical protein n=1 Tax=Natrialba sp. PRR66 TaxID=3098146 RepID=UPI002B1DFE95|nr:hypothetical protein [Natrialba sp. PRR66]